MKNLPIASKILAVLGVFGVFVISVVIYNALQMQSINSGYQRDTKTSISAEIDMTRAGQAITGVESNIEWVLVSSSPEERHAAASRIGFNLKNFDTATVSAGLDLPAQASEFESLHTQGDAVVDTSCALAIKLGVAATTLPEIQASETEYLTNCQPVFAPLIGDMRTEANTLHAQAQADQTHLAATANHTIFVALMAAILGLMAVLLGGYFAVRAWVSSPIKALESTMSKLAGGQLQAMVLGAERKDEIGGMARAVQVFKDGGLEKLRLEEKAKATAAQVEAERALNEAERAEAAAQQRLVVESIATGLEKLSGGDLLFRLTAAFSSDYEKLRGDFNATMEKLQETMQAIAANTQGVRSGAKEITQASDDLSRRTEQQAANLEETAAALDQITATVRRTAEVANEARDLVSTSKTDAERSGDVVRQTVGAMDGIESSSKQIANIIGVIDEIAFQTNLLALNAGVEAARAGDAGRGFAVVATEVRALAQRSADAAKEIKTLISASTQQVDVGVRLVSETGQALGRIVTQVNQLNGLVVELAASAKEQATGLGEVNAAVNQMDQVTQQNAAMVEQATAASHGLSGEAQELARLVGQFDIGESVAAPVLKRAVPKVLPKPRTVVTTSARKVVMLPSQDRARHPAPAGAADDWSEF